MANNRMGIPVILFLTTLSSCTIVKENRDTCPCNLVVEITGVRDTPAALLVKSLRDSSYLDLLSVERDTLLTLYVPRGGVWLSAWSGAPAADEFIIPSGAEAPPLYLWHGKVNASGELAYADVKLHKQFCTLSVEVEGPPGWGPPIGTAVRGHAGGMSLSGAIIPGTYLYSPSEPTVAMEGNTVLMGSIRLPRQKPDSQLLLDIVMEDNIIRTFSLGTYLQKAGYSWTAMDLEDITVHMDLSVTTITFSSPGLSEPVQLVVDI